MSASPRFPDPCPTRGAPREQRVAPAAPRAPWLLALGALVLALGLAVQSEPVRGQTTGTQSTPLSAPPAFASSDSNGRMIAVSGVDLTGQSVLYLIDTVDKQLAVYQASGGSGSSSGLRLVGARRIDLDLQLIGYRDRSEYTYQDLQQEFSKR